ncbi:hypothetical protein F5984_03390 [Rudanella paleaurantiibacter]|uniref:T9SS type A sorting domain-containing protein n=1 Tax=Rudanella paleaurantiibacter TaxID=2614655 RepID=A0A7J5U768_9BACT|nr:T9SS type A sorting domain-containing protein [Rudanella paleaurantiibacter]KAB7733000.1 hypothetical protein F5984_03390 [Rudanella paleaurantiibacter]
MFTFLQLATVAQLFSAAISNTPAPATEPIKTAKSLSFAASAYVNQHSHLRVSLYKSEPGIVAIRLYDQNRHVLYNTSTGKKQLKAAWQLDLSELPNGTYTLEFNGREGQLVRQIKIGTPHTSRTIAVQ